MKTFSAVCYGDSLESQGTMPTDRLFTGQRLDGTGLYYYGARYYDPAIGRFISADPIVQNFANPQSLNRYSYVFNNPLKYVDPSGLAVEIGDTDISDLNDIVAEILDYEEWGEEPPPDLIERLIELMEGLGEGGIDTWDDWERYARENPGIADILEESESVFTFRGTIPGQSGRSVMGTIGQEIFDSFGRANAYGTTLLGLTLAGMTNSASLRFGPGGTLVFEGIETSSTTGWLMRNVLNGMEAFTVGYVIITTAPQIDRYLQHELGHVTQAALLGPGYLPAYGIGWYLGGWRGHDLNVMESRFLPNWPRR